MKKTWEKPILNLLNNSTVQGASAPAFNCETVVGCDGCVVNTGPGMGTSMQYGTVTGVYHFTGVTPYTSMTPGGGTTTISFVYASVPVTNSQNWSASGGFANGGGLCGTANCFCYIT